MVAALIAAALLNMTVRGWLPAPVAWFALAPLMIAVGRSRSALGAALLTALAASGLALPAFEGALPAVPWLFPVLVALGCAPFLLAGFVVRRWRSRFGNGLVPLVLSAAWVAAEVIASQRWLWGQLASPIALGYSQADGPLLPLASVAGVQGLSLAVLLINAVVATLHPALGSRWRAALPAFVSLGLFLGVLAAAPRAADGQPVSPTIRAALAQPALPLPLYDAALTSEPALSHILARLRELTERAEDPRLVIWPESAVPENVAAQLLSDDSPSPESGTFHTSFLQQLSSLEILAGANIQFAGGTHNSVVHAWAGQSERVFDKLAPVPVGEAHIKPGSSLVVGDWADRRVAPLICLDALYPDFAREVVSQGADLLVVISDDSFAMQMGTPRLHLRATVLRAVENAVPILFSSASGPSALINPDGSLGDALPVGESATLTVLVPPAQAPTIYTRYGNWSGWLCCLLAIAFSAVGSGSRLKEFRPRRAVFA